MAFELPSAREAREKAEAAFREQNIRRYEQSMGVQLPYSPVAAVERKPESNVKSEVAAEKVNVNSNVKVNVKRGFDRKGYMRDYMKRHRAKEKKCPHCGGKL